ncbi:efflux RND transporter periplasmic adaptor subunit [Flagellimonas aequoris]|uniref:Efflux RND transporter periplasmic adaptor subunit n=1 Tax=Flagellimonas aequoris TaxID=2306997 RepID=A0A418N237_9FLAO|nr:efflux RND transporter periplasmic adaptor subunit [Allomuricauda aequoris]RIV67390.1 efflux RND transporter periplasmic adaptor subunit [Allomuricauda aequoris]TXJ99210.1 efflux RND transporter periplasmic adaptor subunit [Allomuricauda aequoris]
MKKTSKIVVPTLVIVIVFVAIAFILNSNKKKNEAETAIVSKMNNSVNVQVDTVKLSALNVEYTNNGLFEPFQELEFSAEQSGRVSKVYVEEGDEVRVGQPLAIVKTDQLSVELENAKAAFRNAQSNNERYQNAFKTGGVTKQQVDQAALDLQNAKAQLDRASIQYGDATIKATINGMVNKRSVEPGTVVSPGTALFELVDVSRLKLKSTLNEINVAHLNKGDTVVITASAIPGRQFTGVIGFIAPKADSSLNFPVEVEVLNTENFPLKAGMYGSMSFKSSQSEKLTVNRKAFVGSVSNYQVFVIQPDSTVVLRKVIPGLVSEKNVEVINGLKKGELVVVSGQINLEDGTKVRSVN